MHCSLFPTAVCMQCETCSNNCRRLSCSSAPSVRTTPLAPSLPVLPVSVCFQCPLPLFFFLFLFNQRGIMNTVLSCHRVLYYELQPTVWTSHYPQVTRLIHSSLRSSIHCCCCCTVLFFSLLFSSAVLWHTHTTALTFNWDSHCCCSWQLSKLAVFFHFFFFFSPSRAPSFACCSIAAAVIAPDGFCGCCWLLPCAAMAIQSLTHSLTASLWLLTLLQFKTSFTSRPQAAAATLLLRQQQQQLPAEMQSNAEHCKTDTQADIFCRLGLRR